MSNYSSNNTIQYSHKNRFQTREGQTEVADIAVKLPKFEDFKKQFLTQQTLGSSRNEKMKVKRCRALAAGHRQQSCQWCWEPENNFVVGATAES